MGLFRSKRRVIPGFGISLGYTVTYLSLVVLLPLATLFVKSATMGWARFWEVVSSTEVMSSYRMSFGASALAGLINVVLGFLVAWVLARYHFFGKRVLDAIIDLPFALPTAVAGIALTTLYSEKGWVGQFLTRVGFAYPWPTWVGLDHGFPFAVHWYNRVALAPLGVVVALTFVGLPFVVRTVQPVLEDLGKDVEEAAASLGANRWQTFWKVILPQVRPALVAGFTMAFARGLGEYGSVLFISGNLPATEIAPHQIISKLEQYDYAGATAIAVVLLVVSFVLLLVINVIQKMSELKVSVA